MRQPEIYSSDFLWFHIIMAIVSRLAKSCALLFYVKLWVMVPIMGQSETNSLFYKYKVAYIHPLTPSECKFRWKSLNGIEVIEYWCSLLRILGQLTFSIL